MPSDDLRIVQNINTANHQGFEVLAGDKNLVDVYATFAGRAAVATPDADDAS